MSRLSRNRKVQDLVHEVEIRSSTHYAVRKEREREFLICSPEGKGFLPR